MNALALGIGLSGQYNVNLDGMDEALAAEKAAAEQGIAARKARDKETSDVLKSATDFVGAAKVAPAYKKAFMSDFNELITDIVDIRKKGGTFGLDSAKRVAEFKADANNYIAASEQFYKVSKDLPYEVVNATMDENGMGRLADLGRKYGQTTNLFGKNSDKIVMYPEKVDNPIEKMYADIEKRKAEVERMGPMTRINLDGTNSFIFSQKEGLNPEVQKNIEEGYLSELTSPQNIQGTILNLRGSIDPDTDLKDNPGGGFLPSDKVIADLKVLIKDRVNAKFNVIKENQASKTVPKTAPASASEKAFTKGAAWTNGNVRGIPYNSRAANTEAPIDINATTYEKTPDGKYIKTQTPPTTISASPAGPVLITGEKDNLYFSYNYTDPRNREITNYLIPGTQKAFIDFVTHLRINDNSTELEAFVEDLSDLVGTNGKELIKKYVDDLHSKGIKITYPQSMGGSSAPAKATPAKPSGSPAKTSSNEVERTDPASGKIAIFDASTKKFIRWK